ncbi:hypothetical protein D3C79_895860 [compost metagenome]
MAGMKQRFFGRYAFTNVEHEVGAERGVGGGGAGKVENGRIGDDFFHGWPQVMKPPRLAAKRRVAAVRGLADR